MELIGSPSNWDNELYEEQKKALQGFEGSLESIRGRSVQILDTSIMLEQMDHAGKISDLITPPPCDGLFLDNRFYYGLKDSGEIPKRISFTMFPLQAIGREESHNKVLFGNLNLQNFSTVPNRSINVAIKPYIGESGPKRALHEYTMNEFLRLNGVNCLPQLGLISFQNSIFSITKFMPEISTLDNIDWLSLDHKSKLNAVTSGLRSLVALHKLGVFHNDSEFRNLPIQPKPNEAWAIDLEFAVSLASTPDNFYGPDGILEHIRQDLQCVYKSFVDFGLVEPQFTATEKFQILYDFILTPYREIVMSQSDDSPFIKQLRSLLDINEKLFFHEALKYSSIEDF